MIRNRYYLKIRKINEKYINGSEQKYKSENENDVSEINQIDEECIPSQQINLYEFENNSSEN